MGCKGSKSGFSRPELGAKPSKVSPDGSNPENSFGTSNSSMDDKKQKFQKCRPPPITIAAKPTVKAVNVVIKKQ